MDRESFFKLPRLYVDAPLDAGGDIALSDDHAHYLHTVLRRKDGDCVRLFNGRDGEWLCVLRDLRKKSGLAAPTEQLHPQPAHTDDIHLYFAPIKKARMDWMIEKAVELGATHLHPVITQNTEIRTVNADRLKAQILEAAEQCERLDIPHLADAIPLDAIPAGVPLLACLERGMTRPLRAALPAAGPVAFLIGPEGGFTAAEAAWIAGQGGWTSVSLGPRILRCETAVCVALTLAITR